MTDKEILKKIQKSKKALIKSQKDEFIPEKLNLKALCEWHNKPEYFNQIRNRIYRAMEQDEELSNYVYIDFDDMENIFIDSDGIIMFGDILKGYFDTKVFADILVEMRKRTEERKELFYFKRALRETETKKIEQLLKLYIKAFGTADEHTQLIKDELVHRNPLKAISLLNK